MEDLKAAVNEHIDQVAELVEKLSAEIRTGFQPAYENFIGFFHAIDWKVGASSTHLLMIIVAILHVGVCIFSFCSHFLVSYLFIAQLMILCGNLCFSLGI